MTKEKRVYTEDEKAMFLYGNLFENYYRTGSVDYLEVSKYGNLRTKYLSSFKKSKFIAAFEVVYPNMLDVLGGSADAEFTVKVFGFDINSINRIPKHWVDFCLYVKNKVDKENQEAAKEPFSVENTLKNNDKHRQELIQPSDKNIEVIDFDDRVLSDLVNTDDCDEQVVLEQLACETDIYQNNGKKVQRKKRA